MATTIQKLGIVMLIGFVLIILAITGCKKNDNGVQPIVVVPITDNLFPIVLGHTFTYTGYAIGTNGIALQDTNHVYNTIWTIGPPNPYVPGSTVLVDTTTLQHPLYGVIGVKKNLLIKKDTTTGDFTFYQTLGPFFRAFGISRTDTVRAILLAKLSAGMNGEWVALDSTYTGAGGSIRLEIHGKVEASEIITDSSASHTSYNTVRFRTWRRISVNGAIIVDNATTSKLWLAKDIGPIQVLITQDTENLGHFRVLKAKNF